MAKKKSKIKKAKTKNRKPKAKKRAKKIVKAVKSKKAKKINKITAGTKAVKEKMLGRVEHYFDKISVAAIAVKAPFKVGDSIHIKGHTTDFSQPVESLQIEHASVEKVKKGDDVGMKVKEHVRQHDIVYLAGKGTAAKLKPAAASRPAAPYVQTSIFEAGKIKMETPPVAKPAAAPAPKPAPKAADPYQEKKFFSF